MAVVEQAARSVVLRRRADVHFLESVPLSATWTFAYPFCRLLSAVAADIYCFCFCHVLMSVFFDFLSQYYKSTNIFRRYKNLLLLLLYEYEKLFYLHYICGIGHIVWKILR